MIVHLLRASYYTACGYWHIYVVTSDDPAAVTCGNCLRTPEYRERAGIPAPQPARIPGECGLFSEGE